MEMSRFIEAAKSTPSCASCVFFEKNETWSSESSYSNAIASRSTSGRCLRFPPSMVMLATEDKDARFDYPNIRVTITELSLEGFTDKEIGGERKQDTFFRIDDDQERLPLCGEHKTTDVLDYDDCDSW